MTNGETSPSELADDIGTAVAMYDSSGHIVYVNEWFVALGDAAREDIEGQAVWEINPGFEREQFPAYWDSVGPDERVLAETHLAFGEKLVPVEVSTTRTAVDGEPYHLCTVRDLRDRQARRRVLEQFRQAIEASGHAIFLTDPDGAIRYVNDAFEEVTGYAGQEVFGEDPHVLNSGEMPDEYWERFWDTIMSGDQWDGVVVNRRKSGEFYHAKQTVSPVLDADGEVQAFVAVQDDITERIERERTLTMLGQVFRHTLRNQLNVIVAYAERLDAGSPAEPNPQQQILDCVDALVETGKKGNDLVSFLGTDTYRRRVDFAEIVPTVVSTYERRHPSVTISTEMADAVDALAVTNVERALEELIENAIKHNDTDRPTVEIRVESDPDTCQVHVRDNGPSIPEMDRSVLDGAESIDKLYHASGLGLWLVYWIVRRSGGAITVADTEPRGNVVTMTFDRPTE